MHKRILRFGQSAAAMDMAKLYYYYFLDGYGKANWFFSLACFFFTVRIISSSISEKTIDFYPLNLLEKNL